MRWSNMMKEPEMIDHLRLLYLLIRLSDSAIWNPFDWILFGSDYFTITLEALPLSTRM